MHYLLSARRTRRWLSQKYVAIPILISLIFLYRYLNCLTHHQHTCLPKFWPFYTPPPLEPPPTRTNLMPGKPEVNLVVATVVGDDISWTSSIAIPNLMIVRYYTDNQLARFHPPKPKGREALMYLTYLHDFYDQLPDISIFIHAHENPWHVEHIVKNNLSYALNRLDLDQVQKRGYVNLRVSWVGACPDWINTTRSQEDVDPNKIEEPFMAQAFRENFHGNGEVEVPEILAQPAGDQFAVTKELIRAIRKNQYARHVDWLVNTEMIDYISGRFWEHGFQYLFLGKAVDCPVEWKTWCRMYGICFPDQEQLNQHVEMGWERVGLLEDRGWWRELRYPEKGKHAKERLAVIEPILEARMKDALERGKDEKWRMEGMGNLYE